MYSRGFDVCDRADVQGDAALSNAPGRQSPEGPALVLEDGLPDWDGIGKVDGGVDAHGQQAINLLGMRVLLHIPAISKTSDQSWKANGKKASNFSCPKKRNEYSKPHQW